MQMSAPSLRLTSYVVNGYYTTPEIKGESVLSISYEIDTAINSLSLKDVKVSGYDGEIRISNIDEPSDVCVYSIDGKFVGNVNAALDELKNKMALIDADLKGIKIDETV